MYKCKIEECTRMIKTRRICGACATKKSSLAKGRKCVDCNVAVGRTATRCKTCSGKHRVGNNHPNYKNGTRKATGGYIQVLVGPKQYQPEHRVIMEKHLGRALLPNENVHHKNGIRTDNRLENLELWVVPQPYGQRAADLLEWAKQIIDLYEGVDL